jgi:hypothetical protein
MNKRVLFIAIALQFSILSFAQAEDITCSGAFINNHGRTPINTYHINCIFLNQLLREMLRVKCIKIFQN